LEELKKQLINSFDNKLQIKYDFNQDEIIQLVLSDKNRILFSNIIKEAELSYFDEVSKTEKKIIKDENWNIPDSIRFNERYERNEYKKSIMAPFFIAGNWNTEKKFIEYIENNSQNIEWWFKNGDRDAIYFAVPYDFENETRLFYIDFIIKFKDGRIGLFDTKTGITLRDSKNKSDGLQKYIKEETKKGKKLFGGIVTNTDQQDLKGRWIYFDGKKDDLSDKNFEKWENFEL